MHVPRHAVLLRIFLGEADRFRGRPLYEAGQIVDEKFRDRVARGLGYMDKKDLLVEQHGQRCRRSLDQCSSRFAISRSKPASFG